MLIYSNIKNSARNKPLTLCMCWNPCLWIEPWYGWLCFWVQNLSSWGHCSSQTGADIRLLVWEQIYFTCICFLLNITAGKGNQLATKDSWLSLLKSNLSISYRNRHWQLPKEYLSILLPLESWELYWRSPRVRETANGEEKEHLRFFIK